ncbi:MAG: DUF3667 domain-containing protein [Salegentibacter sp.]|uniref:DUF3667 domain-containing protein n=1 Tax=Salegentibacter sp. TaxID=1903072 RepID=UPI00286FF295|nr:DUF3667 domain-containing protein [Salegentibacter sp.]MDR9456863.1 DUF3667 domain-containing protein [Salegentibacter sp.]
MEEERNHLKYRGERCLNCGHKLDNSDKYCPACGQLNSTKKLALDDFFNEFFAGIFAYDSRFRRTIKALLFSPGKISKDYIMGKRMRYANPFRFYLSASIIFFIIWGFINSFEIQPATTDFNSEEIETSQKTIDSLDIPRPQVGGREFKLDSLIKSQQAKDRETYQKVYKDWAALDSLSLIESSSNQFNIYSKYYKQTGVLSAEQALDSLHHPQSNFNHWLYKKATDWNILKNNPQIFLNYFINKLPFIIFFYLPVFAFFIWLLYLRRPFNYMEHLIFTFHVQTTFFVLYGLAILIDHIFNTNLGITIATLIFIFYLYKAMRKFYGQSHVKTIVKFMLLNIIFFTLAIIAGVVSIIASFALY